MTLVRKSLLLLVLMPAACGSAIALWPTARIADERSPIDLIALIPKRFADCHEDPPQCAAVVNPQQEGVLDKIYKQTLSRTYINAKGYRIMLSVAYGGDQSDLTQVHRAEVCCPAQCFQLLNKAVASIALPFGLLRVAHVDTRLGQRREPITYWITVGDRIVQGNAQTKLAEMRFRFAGKTPDGLSFRVSSIDPEAPRAYDLQTNFINQALGSVTSEQRQRLAGSSGRT
ncbi:exosortase-associated protein EpsI, B-type [Accumulibacter sp.]|uniref:EpsI family protein n=1 Tax=Accumulibacter regalis TaxID=522306 RepID=C7RNP4_ACCRE|nr:exosortase-associated protein EpsI, B-type [Accumulibacter sp.]MBN8498363.1 EpsI family protein [Accumulibacter sp.]MBO3714181.1 EpsI family protein [Accumulibacter sp.]